MASLHHIIILCDCGQYLCVGHVPLASSVVGGAVDNQGAGPTANQGQSTYAIYTGLYNTTLEYRKH